MWQVIGASVAGRWHSRHGVPCQDAYAYEILREGVVVAVADGLGSAPRSEEGAFLVVNRGIDSLKSALNESVPTNVDEWKSLLSSAFLDVREALESKAQEEEEELRHFATTLILAVVMEQWLAIGHIGDGAVVMLSTDGKVEMASSPQESEYVNEVMPLTSEKALEQVRYDVYQENIKAVALLTDGLQHLSISTVTGEPYEGFFVPFFEAVSGGVLEVKEANRSLEEFLTSERVAMKVDDDKTLVLVGRVAEEK